MEVRRIPTYGMASNCYVISDGRESAVVDPSAKLEYITAALADAGTELKYILLTHGHFDHTKTLTKLREATGAEVCVHADDDEMLSDSDKNAYSLFNVGTQNAESADILLHDGDRLKVGSATVTVIHTPGHSKGSVCYQTGRDLFTGDTAFPRFRGKNGLLRFKLRSAFSFAETAYRSSRRLYGLSRTRRKHLT